MAFAWLAFVFLFTPGDHPIAITGATVVVDGKITIEKCTVVLRRGVIEAVGPNVEPPFDAEIVKGDGLVVYAGFIDGHTTVGLPDVKRPADAVKAAEGEQTDFQKKVLAHMAEANRKGIHTDLEAAALIDAKEDALKKWRGAGFATALVLPGDELLGGRAALLDLSGQPRRDAILRSPLGFYASTHTYGEGYPATPMGTYAQIRQTLLDAGHYARIWESYKPGQPRPPIDDALAALLPVIDGAVPLYWEANSENEIRRALAMGDEFKLTVVITGGEEAHKCVDALAGRSVILSLKWPKEVKEVKDDDKYEEGSEPEPRKVRKDKRAKYEEKVRCAKKLHEAGIDFCFSSRGLDDPKDVLEHIEKLVEWGLPREAAIAALTTAPAKLFGVSDLAGSVAAGKTANLTVLNKSLGEKDVLVRFVFADGVKFEFEEPKKPEVDLTGTWALTVETPTGAINATLELKQEGRKLTGTAKGTYVGVEFAKLELSSGSVAAKEATFTIPYNVGKEKFNIEFKGELKDDVLSGTVKTPMWSDVTFTAKKPKENE